MARILLSREKLQDIRSDTLSDDIALEECMRAWTEAEVEAYFLSGGIERPAEQRHELAPPARSILPPPPPVSLSGSGCLPGREWRTNHVIRQSHWLCRVCELAYQRSTLACGRCHAADHSSSALTAETLRRILELMPGCASLTALDLSHNALGARGVAAVAHALPSARSLVSLNLSATGAANEGAVAIAAALSAPAAPPVRKLQLVGCFINEEGGEAFAMLLRTRGSLEELNLGWNAIRGEGARALAEAAVKAPLLASVCGVPLAVLRQGRLPAVPPLTERDLRRRPAIEPSAELHLQGHGCGAPGAHAISQLLPRLPRLLALVMPYQDLKDEGAETIARAAAEHCPQLKFVMLSRNEVSASATDRIRQLLPQLDNWHLRLNNRGG